NLPKVEAPKPTDWRQSWGDPVATKPPQAPVPAQIAQLPPAPPVLTLPGPAPAAAPVVPAQRVQSSPPKPGTGFVVPGPAASASNGLPLRIQPVPYPIVTVPPGRQPPLPPVPEIPQAPQVNSKLFTNAFSPPQADEGQQQQQQQQQAMMMRAMQMGMPPGYPPM